MRFHMNTKLLLGLTISVLIIYSSAKPEVGEKICERTVSKSVTCHKSYKKSYQTRTSCSLAELWRDFTTSVDICIWGKKKVTRLRTAYYRFVCPKIESIATCCPGETETDGGKCQKGCGNAKFGENCDKNCSCPANAYDDCDKFSGNCTCKEGWFGENCIEACTEGWYGPNCENVCQCKNGSLCDRFSGYCYCTMPGWYGDDCSEPCEPGMYGYNCSGVCDCKETETCDSISGNCTCKAGLTGPNCTENCSPRKYGPDCQFSCSCNWNYTEMCNSSDGTCTCTPGRDGVYCNEDCSSGKYGRQCQGNCTCEPTEYCDKRDGSCLSGFCLKENTQNCPHNTSRFVCPNHDDESRNEICSPENFSSANETFERKLIGFCCNASYQTEICFVEMDVCECHPGYKGEYCEKECEPGTYGYNCSGVCVCKETETCDSISGVCRPVCSPGLTGPNCTQKCDDWKYGENCLNTCDCNRIQSVGCDHIDGSCQCFPSWSGRRCTEEKLVGQMFQEQVSPGLIVSIVLPICVILTVSLLVVVMLRRRNIRKQNTAVKGNDNTAHVNVVGTDEQKHPVNGAGMNMMNPTYDSTKNEDEYHVLDRTGRNFDNRTVDETTYSYARGETCQDVDKSDYSHVVRGRVQTADQDMYDVTQIVQRNLSTANEGLYDVTQTLQGNSPTADQDTYDVTQVVQRNLSTANEGLYDVTQTLLGNSPTNDQNLYDVTQKEEDVYDKVVRNSRNKQDDTIY